MTALIVPVDAQASQTLSVVLSGKQVTINLYSRGGDLFADVFLSDAAIVRCRACLDRVPLVMDAYRGFPGDLFFLDRFGTSDPVFSGLGNRYLLVYMEIPA